jgi:hypothetical protein
VAAVAEFSATAACGFCLIETFHILFYYVET